MNNYQYIIFDLDGTLSNSKEGITKSVQFALEKQGIIEKDLNALEHFIGPPLKAHFMESYDMSDDEATKAVADYRSRYIPVGLYETELYPGTKEMLQALKAAGRTIAMATSKPHFMAEEVSGFLGIAPYFDFIQGADLHGPILTKEDVLEALFKQMHADKSKCVMIGDTNFDVNGASIVGIDCIGVSFGFGDKKEMLDNGALLVVDSMDELAITLTKEGEEI